MEGIKEQLFSECQSLISKRIDEIRSAIRLLQTSANEETKSSAGDKYETGRAMMQIEIENLTNQLAESQKLLNTLSGIKLQPTDRIQVGSVVYTSIANYFIAVSAGQIVVDNNKYMSISPGSPIGSKLLGLKAGDRFHFNNREINIVKVI